MLVERACALINKEAELLLENKENNGQYHLYKVLYSHYEQKDEMLADCFDDYRRSKAKMRILSLVRYGILSDDEFQGFSDDTKEFVRFMESADRK